MHEFYLHTRIYLHHNTGGIWTKKEEEDSQKALKDKLKDDIKKKHPDPGVIVYSPPSPPTFQPAQQPSQPMRKGKVIEAGH